MTDWRSYRGKLAETIHYNSNHRAVMAYAGNDLEMPGYNEEEVLKAFETNEMRLGDLQKSAMSILNVITRTMPFDKLLNNLVQNDSKIAAQYYKAQSEKAAEQAQAEVEKARAEAEAARKEAELAKEKAEQAQAEAEKAKEGAEQAKADAAKAKEEADKAQQKADAGSESGAGSDKADS